MEETEFDVKDMVGLLRRRARLILVTFIAVVGLAVIAAAMLVPLYTATTLILVDTTRKSLLDPNAPGANAMADSAKVDSEVEILRSDAVLLAVAASNDLVNDPEFGVSPGPGARLMAFLGLGEVAPPTEEEALQHALTGLREATTIARRGFTYLIAVEVRSREPARAAALANAIAAAYIDDQLRAKIDGVLAASRILAGRVEQARAGIIASERRLDDFIAANIEQAASRPGTGVARLRASLDALTARRAEAEEQIRGIEAGLLLWEGIGNAAQGADAVPSLRAEIAGIDAEIGDLRRRMQAELIAGDMPLDTLTGLFELQQTADLARAQYRTLLARSGDLAVQAELQLSDSRIVSPALPPTAPSFPDTALIVTLAGIAGLGLGLGLAFIHENFVGGFTSEAQLSAVTRRPALGAVPFQKLGADLPSAPLLMVEAPLSGYAESIRRIRAGIDQLIHGPDAAPYRPGGGKGRTIMVSSAVTGEGKTTIALSLARAYAASGKQTLIVDCDLRKPAIHKHLNLDPGAGLLEYLAGRSEAGSLASMVMRDEDTGLSVLVGSRRSDIPTDQLVTGATFTRLIEAAVNHFDVIVLDTPPILPVVDGLYLARHADAIVFVVKWSSTAQTAVRSAIERLDRSRRGHTQVVAVLSQEAGGGADGGYYTG